MEVPYLFQAMHPGHGLTEAVIPRERLQTSQRVSLTVPYEIADCGTFSLHTILTNSTICVIIKTDL